MTEHCYTLCHCDLDSKNTFDSVWFVNIVTSVFIFVLLNEFLLMCFVDEQKSFTQIGIWRFICITYIETTKTKSKTRATTLHTQSCHTLHVCYVPHVYVLMFTLSTKQNYRTLYYEQVSGHTKNIQPAWAVTLVTLTLVIIPHTYIKLQYRNTATSSLTSQACCL